VDCSALVSDLRRRRESGENFDSIITDLEYGVDAELEEFARRLLVLLTDAMEGTMNTVDNGLSASSQQANSSFNLTHLLEDSQMVTEYGPQLYQFCDLVVTGSAD